MEFSVKLYEKEALLLSEFMKQNNIKSKAQKIFKKNYWNNFLLIWFSKKIMMLKEIKV